MSITVSNGSGRPDLPRDLPQGTELRVTLKSDTEITGKLRVPIAYKTVTEGLGGYHLTIDGLPSISLSQIRKVTVLDLPEQFPDAYPYGAVVLVYVEDVPAVFRKNSDGTWRRLTASGCITRSWEQIVAEAQSARKPLFVVRRYTYSPEVKVDRIPGTPEYVETTS